VYLADFLKLVQKPHEDPELWCCSHWDKLALPAPGFTAMAKAMREAFLFKTIIAKCLA
jgi:hypothetical protein